MAGNPIQLTIGATNPFTFTAARTTGATTLDSMLFEAFNGAHEAILSLQKETPLGIIASVEGNSVVGSIKFEPEDTAELNPVGGNYKLWLVEEDGDTWVVASGRLTIARY